MRFTAPRRHTESAWFMLHRIRLAMQNGTLDKLSGHVEVDETYIGGKARNMHRADRARKIHGTGFEGKVAVMGLLERHGEVRTMVVRNNKRKSLRLRLMLTSNPVRWSYGFAPVVQRSQLRLHAQRDQSC